MPMAGILVLCFGWLVGWLVFCGSPSEQEVVFLSGSQFEVQSRSQDDTAFLCC